MADVDQIDPDVAEAFECLRVPHTASMADVRRARDDSALIWHPDRLPSNASEALRRRAQDELKRINAAYGRLKAYHEAAARDRSKRTNEPGGSVGHEEKTDSENAARRPSSTKAPPNPKLVLPNAARLYRRVISESDCVEAVSRHMVADEDAPDDLLDQHTDVDFQCSYEPLFRYEIGFDASWSADVGYNYTHEWMEYDDVAKRTVRRTATRVRWEPASGNLSGEFSLCAPANQAMAASHEGVVKTGMAESFVVRGTVAPRGTPLDAPAVDANYDARLAYQKHCKARADQRITSQASAMVPGDIHRNLNVSAAKSAREQLEYIPFFKYHYSYQGKKYHVIVDGVTGSVHGHLPSSLKRVALASLMAIGTAASAAVYETAVDAWEWLPFLCWVAVGFAAPITYRSLIRAAKAKFTKLSQAERLLARRSIARHEVGWTSAFVAANLLVAFELAPSVSWLPAPRTTPPGEDVAVNAALPATPPIVHRPPNSVSDHSPATPEEEWALVAKERPRDPARGLVAVFRNGRRVNTGLIAADYLGPLLHPGSDPWLVFAGAAVNDEPAIWVRPVHGWLRPAESLPLPGRILDTRAKKMGRTVVLQDVRLFLGRCLSPNDYSLVVFEDVRDDETSAWASTTLVIRPTTNEVVTERFDKSDDRAPTFEVLVTAAGTSRCKAIIGPDHYKDN